MFHAHYGSSGLTIAAMWHDLKSFANLREPLSPSERGNKGLKHFLVACHILWANPKNANLTASRFDMCIDYVCGESMWLWIRRIYYLKDKVIKWPPSLDHPRGPRFAITIDGVDKKTWEMKHPTLNKDPKTYTKKHNHGGLKYQIALCVHSNQCVHFYGPKKAGQHDQTLLRESGVLDRLKPGKLAIVDRGYIANQHRDKLAWPNTYDEKDVENYKSRARARHESFNGRMGFFKIMTDVFDYDKKKHKYAFGAVCTTVQYQMNNGSPLFRV